LHPNLFATLGCVINHLNARAVRRAAFAVALTPAILVVTAAGPALAEAPQEWGPQEPVNRLHALLVLGAIPLGLFVLITLLVYAPSMVRGEKYHPGLAWRNEPEWFGGPRGGVEATDKVDPKEIDSGSDSSSKRGGASAHW
jgi:hypothetical protein